MTSGSQRSWDVCVVGAGVIGLSLAWRLARAGARVRVFDRGRAGAGASGGAGGMLAPASELLAEPKTDDALLRAGRDSLALWPGFVSDLRAQARTDPQFERNGAIAPVFAPNGDIALADAARRLSEAGIRCDLATPQDARGLCPYLAEDVQAALHLPEDAQLHAGALIAALHEACLSAGVVVSEMTSVTAIKPGPTPELALIGENGASARETCGTVVVAAGWRAGQAFPEGVRAGMLPITGQLALLRLREPRPIAAPLIRTDPVYLVFFPDGSVLAGATMRPGEADDSPDPAADARLRAAARRAAPALAAAQDVGMWAGVRPGSRDRAPFIGPVADNVILAAGHHRNGILLAPLTAMIVQAQLEGRGHPWAARFAPDRASSLTEA